MGDVFFEMNIGNFESAVAKISSESGSVAKHSIDSIIPSIKEKVDIYTPVYQNAYPLPPFHGGTLRDSFTYIITPKNEGTVARFEMSGRDNQNALEDYAFYQESGRGMYRKEGSKPHFLRDSLLENEDVFYEFVFNDFYLLINKYL